MKGLPDIAFLPHPSYFEEMHHRGKLLVPSPQNIFLYKNINVLCG